MLLRSDFSEVGLEIVNISCVSWIENILQVEVPNLSCTSVFCWWKVSILDDSFVLEYEYFGKFVWTGKINFEAAKGFYRCSVAIFEKSRQELLELGDLGQNSVVEFVDGVIEVRNLNLNELLSGLLRWVLNYDCKFVIFCVTRNEVLVIFLEVKIVSHIKYFKAMLLVKLFEEELSISILDDFVTISSFGFKVT